MHITRFMVLLAVLAAGCAEPPRSPDTTAFSPIHYGATPARTEEPPSRTYSPVSAGPLEYWPLRTWRCSRIERTTLAGSDPDPDGRFLLVALSVFNQGAAPLAVPSPVIIDGEGRVYEQVQERWLARDSLVGFERLNPQAGNAFTLAFEVPAYETSLKLVVFDPSSDRKSEIPL